MKKNRVWLNLLLVGIILAILIIVIVVKNDMKSIFNVIKSADYKYILLAILFVILYLLFTAFSLMRLVKLRARINPFDSFNIANCSQFYNGITPFASGGQPFQVYYYTKVNVKPNVSTSVLMMNFIIHQFVLNVFSILALILYFKQLVAESTTAFRIAIVIGLLINFVVFMLLIFVSLSKTCKKFFMWLVGLVYSIKPLRKKKEAMIEKTNEFFDKSQASFKELFSHIPTLLLSLTYKILSLVVYFLVPFFIFKALGVEVGVSNIFFILWMTAFAFVIMSFMPTPGASGGAEWAFTEVFASSFGVTSEVTVSALLLWRFFTYYIVMIIGAISAICVKRRKEDEEECELESSQTATSPKSTE